MMFGYSCFCLPIICIYLFEYCDYICNLSVTALANHANISSFSKARWTLLYILFSGPVSTFVRIMSRYCASSCVKSILISSLGTYAINPFFYLLLASPLLLTTIVFLLYHYTFLLYFPLKEVFLLFLVKSV